MFRPIGIALVLALVTLLAYARVDSLQFVDYDDPFFVLDNPTVNGGLTVQGLRDAFATTHHGQWQPVSWTSHMLDVELFGLDPRGHHRTSLALHLLNVLLAFAALLRLTGRQLESGCCALLFAVHPLHVESVAWVSSRKDLLSLAFGLLAIWIYAGHRGGSLWRSPIRLLAIVAAHALALMAKPMLVTLPFLLLLLDAWPLGRWREGCERVRSGDAPERLGLGGLVLEKLPLLLLSAAAAVVVRAAVDAEGEAPDLSFGERAANAIVSYGRYLKKAVWPDDLAVAYPHPSLTIAGGWPTGTVVLAACVVVAGFVLARWAWPRRAAFTVGWLWFAGTLVPVLGVSSIAGHAMADRYTYLPLLGLYVAVVMSVGDVLRAAGRPPRVVCIGVSVLGLGVAGALVLVTRAQTAHWVDTEALWRQALRETEHNYVAAANLGRLLMERGDYGGAHANYVFAIRVNPDIAEPHANMGVLYERQEEFEAARNAFRRAFELEPDDPDIRLNLAFVLMKLKEHDEARALLALAVAEGPEIARAHHGYGLALRRTGESAKGLAELQRAVALAPDVGVYHEGVARALLEDGQAGESLAAFRRALALDPELYEAHVNLGLAALQVGDRPSARTSFEAALRIDPDEPLVHRRLGGLLLDAGEFEAAITHLGAAVERGGDDAETLGLLGYACEVLRRWPEAVRHYERAVELEPEVAEHQNNLAGVLWRSGRLQEAVAAYRRAIQIDPRMATAHSNLGLLKQSLGDLTGAVLSHQRALAIDPDNLASADNLAWILATSPDPAMRDGARAVALAESVVERADPVHGLQLATLAAAYAETGRFAEAVERQEEALARLPAHRTEEHTARLELYRRNEPYRDRPLSERDG